MKNICTAFAVRLEILLDLYIRQILLSKQIIPCYQTKFTPLKKQSKQSKALSENIKKFLARKEEEEKQKVLEEKKKKEVNLQKLLNKRTIF